MFADHSGLLVLVRSALGCGEYVHLPLLGDTTSF